MLDFNVGLVSSADADKLWDLIIIGGGPAGLTAGLYAARYKLSVLLLEKGAVSGGQLMSTEWVENYPGFPEPILGSRLAADMAAQARFFGLEILSEPVQDVTLAGQEKIIQTAYSTYRAKALLIATGSSPRKLGLDGEQEYTGKGVSYCATCDGPFYPDKVVGVVGGGNSALEESLFLARYARKVHIIHRRDTFSADKVIQERIGMEQKISIITNSVVTSLNYSDTEQRSITLQNNVDGSTSILPVDGLFVFAGSVPNTSLFAGQLETRNGYVVTDREHRTSVEGVWAAGDVQDKALRQVATAVGDGAAAAFYINKYLMEH